MDRPFSISRLTVDRKARLARLWSNEQLAAVAPLFHGDVVNVSAWTDDDKQDSSYRSYFTNASSYTITNHPTMPRGLQHPDDVALDLCEQLPPHLREAFDVVFNHTVLEHI